MFTRHSTSVVASSLIAIAVLATSVATAQRLTNNVSEGIHRASDLGRMDPTTEINITVQMKLRDEAAFNKVVDALYDPSSPTFHKWLTDADLQQYAPPKEQYEAVRKELENHGLAITSVDENSFSIRAHGTTENVESAFNTEIHQFQSKRKSFQIQRHECTAVRGCRESMSPQLQALRATRRTRSTSAPSIPEQAKPLAHYSAAQGTGLK